ncbi:hypothetical protein [Undibacterium sp. TS12]|uniref:hypothetical protein n=1 Tax=Undibacterium sp. TS12 TaxID=2908202 RepID=UPI001F4CD7DC|nr:hypothetical protein [Undibacterium sp. TS12]MCH8623087.1 hypothetical protein [Undibacterium sp. TS12]
MLVLGLHVPVTHPPAVGQLFASAYQGGAAALIRDGVLLAAMTDEETNLSDHIVTIPYNAIASCLNQCGINWDEIDAIVIDTSEDALDTKCRNLALEDASIPVLDSCALISECFSRFFKIDVRSRLHFCDHILAHVYSGLHASDCEDSLCICIDDAVSSGGGGVAECTAGVIRPMVAWSKDQSLARILQFSADLLTLYGAKPLQRHELGLSGDGQLYKHLFSRLVRLLPNGNFHIASEAEYLDAIQRTPVDTASASFRTDIIASACTACCNVLDHVLRHYLNQTNARSIILTGNVASIPVFASHLANKLTFCQVSLPKWAADTGNAIGAAQSQHPLSAQSRQRHLAIIQGQNYPAQAGNLEDIVDQWKDIFTITSLVEPEQTAAALLANGEMIAWMQGSPGFGVVPCGQWAILADSRLNTGETDKSEFFFDTLCVLDEFVTEYFTNTTAASSLRYFNSGLKDAGTHSLGDWFTASHSVSALKVNATELPYLHGLMSHFLQETGIPALRLARLENELGHPLTTLSQVIPLLLNSCVDAVIADHCLIRPIVELKLTQFANRLKLRLAPEHQLARYTDANGKKNHAVEMCAPQAQHTYVRPVSAELFSILNCHEQESSLSARCMLLGNASESAMEQLLHEILPLWRMKAVEVQMMN